MSNFFIIFLIVISFNSSTIAFSQEGVHQLKSLFGSTGNHISESHNPQPSLQMIHEYLLVKFQSHDRIPAYNWTYRSDRIPVGLPWTGTLIAEAAIHEVHMALDQMGRLDKNKNSVDQILYRLLQKGIEIGFDGLGTNRCGEPVPYLLIIDPVHGKLDGIDMRPCSPSSQ